MLTHVEPLVGSIYDHRVLRQSFRLEVIEHATYILIERLYRFGVVTHVTLILPLRQLITCEVCLIEGIDDRLVVGIPCRPLCRIETCILTLDIGVGEACLHPLTQHLQVVHDIHIVCAGDAQLLLCSRQSTLVVVVEILRQLEGFVLIECQV